jgi:hypothetical protein
MEMGEESILVYDKHTTKAKAPQSGSQSIAIGLGSSWMHAPAIATFERKTFMRFGGG